MFNFRAWGERIAAENAQNGARARWELYQGEEGRLHYELDLQAVPLQTWANNVAESMKAIAPMLQEAFAQVAEAFRPVAQAVTMAVRDLAELVK